MFYVDTFLQRFPPLRRRHPQSCLLENCWREPTGTAVSRALRVDLLSRDSPLALKTEAHKQHSATASCFGPADPSLDEPELIEGDIAVRPDGKNADPCTSRGCMWNKWSDGKVYIPYYIANHYCKHLCLESDFSFLISNSVIMITFYHKIIENITILFINLSAITSFLIIFYFLCMCRHICLLLCK